MNNYILSLYRTDIEVLSHSGVIGQGVFLTASMLYMEVILYVFIPFVCMHTVGEGFCKVLLMHKTKGIEEDIELPVPFDNKTLFHQLEV